MRHIYNLKIPHKFNEGQTQRIPWFLVLNKGIDLLRFCSRQLPNRDSFLNFPVFLDYFAVFEAIGLIRKDWRAGVFHPGAEDDGEVEFIGLNDCLPTSLLLFLPKISRNQLVNAWSQWKSYENLMGEPHINSLIGTLDLGVAFLEYSRPNHWGFQMWKYRSLAIVRKHWEIVVNN